MLPDLLAPNLKLVICGSAAKNSWDPRYWQVMAKLI